MPTLVIWMCQTNGHIHWKESKQWLSHHIPPTHLVSMTWLVMRRNGVRTGMTLNITGSAPKPIHLGQHLVEGGWFEAVPGTNKKTTCVSATAWACLQAALDSFLDSGVLRMSPNLPNPKDGCGVLRRDGAFLMCGVRWLDTAFVHLSGPCSARGTAPWRSRCRWVFPAPTSLRLGSAGTAPGY